MKKLKQSWVKEDKEVLVANWINKMNPNKQYLKAIAWS